MKHQRQTRRCGKGSLSLKNKQKPPNLFSSVICFRYFLLSSFSSVTVPLNYNHLQYQAKQLLSTQILKKKKAIQQHFESQVIHKVQCQPPRKSLGLDLKIVVKKQIKENKPCFSILFAVGFTL